MTEMTINTFLDEMEQLLGCDGYISILENTRKLKTENLSHNHHIDLLKEEIKDYWVNPEVLEKAEQKILNLEVVIGDKNMMLKHYRPEEIEELRVDSNELKKIKEENRYFPSAYYGGGPTFRQLYENQNTVFNGQKNKIKYLEKQIEELKQ
tara:strand:+ start:1083 stop:1535 length:453 start_codon:yes stop_codon:yes gene_type:complete